MLEAGEMTTIAIVEPVADSVNYGLEAFESRGDDESIAETLATLDLESGVSADVTKTGALISLSDTLIFDSGEATINESAYPVLDRISGVLNEICLPMSVEGHTDNVPIHTAQFPSNWELSVARAVNVAKYFVEKGNIPPELVSAAGYGEMHPLVPNDTPEHRAMNRRVEIVLIKEGEN